MDSPPNRSAQEAALSAVNLAPVAEPTGTAEPAAQSHGEALTNTHGLLILERSPDGNPSWLACKFCPIFGCRTRRKGYIMMYMAPFKLGKIESHLTKEHPQHWDQFKDLNVQQKKEFFRGKTLPAPEKFRVRMEELKRSWCPNPAKKRKAPKAAVARAPKAPRRRFPPVSGRPATPPPQSSRDDWIGRTSFEAKTAAPVPRRDDSDDDEPPRKRDILAKTGPARREGALPRKNVYQHLREMLQRYSEPFSRDLHKTVNQSLISKTEVDPIAPVWNENSNAMWAAQTLFYLLRGVPVDVATAFLKESNTDDEEPSLDTEGDPSAQNRDVPAKTEEAATTEKREDVKEDVKVEGQDLGSSPHSKQEDIVQQLKHTDISNTPQDWNKLVCDTANSIDIISMLAIKRVLSNELNWAFVITTRPCPIRKDAIEILIPTLRASFPVRVGMMNDLFWGANTILNAVRKFTLTTPTTTVCEANDDAPTSGTKPSEVEVGNVADSSSSEMERDKSVSELVSLIFTAWLVFSQRRDRRRISMDEDDPWVHECVKKCLNHSLLFLNESGGTGRAKSRARAEFGDATIHTDWIAATATDDAAIERARANYSSWNPTMSDPVWASEKRIIRGLARSFQKALAMTPGAKFSATMMYAKEIVNRAITDVEKCMPVIKTLPKLSLDPLHVVSIREGKDAVDTVIGLLDLVYPQWLSRLIGIRSEIPDDAVQKVLETQLVNVIRERRIDNLPVVHESIPDEERPIYPSTLAKMPPDEFRTFVDTYVKEPGNFEEGFIEKLMLQHETLRLKEGSSDELNKIWPLYPSMKQLETFVSGLRLLWDRKLNSGRQDGCRFSGLIYDDDSGEVVDPDIEHTFRARTLMAIEQMEQLDREERRVQGRDAPLNNCCVPWGENWSNLETGSDERLSKGDCVIFHHS